MLHDELKKYTLEELKVGMRVTTEQLSNIYDIYINLYDIELVRDDIGVCKFEGIVESITKNKVPFKHDCENSVLVYNNPMEQYGYYDY